jgi:antitoxin component of RelBE/YafQ-DinJ toxin-antitoxin module
VGSGFLNYINGYVVKSWRTCSDFSAKEYSDQDADGAENTDWKRTCRGLLKGTPCLQEIYCSMSKAVELMSRSVSVEEAFPPVPFKESPENRATTKAYKAFHAEEEEKEEKEEEEEDEEEEDENEEKEEKEEGGGEEGGRGGEG